MFWTFDIFENNFGINYKYLKESCVLHFEQHFSFICFLKTAFVRDNQNNQAVFGPTGING